MEQEKVIVFEINKNYYGTKVNIVNEIMNADGITITDLPNQQHTNIEGISNIRNKVCTIVNGHKLLDMDKKEKSSNEKLIILNKGEAGLLVDDVIEIVDVNEEEKHEFTNKEMKGDYRFIDYLLNYNGMYVTVMHLDDMIIPKENVQ